MEVQSVHSEFTLPKVVLIFLSHCLLFRVGLYSKSIRTYKFTFFECIQMCLQQCAQFVSCIFLVMCRVSPSMSTCCPRLSPIHPSVKGGRYQLWLNWVTLETGETGSAGICIFAIQSIVLPEYDALKK